MIRISTCAVLVFAAMAVPATSAQAQYYYPPQPAPLYPYAVQADQPYAIEVAPGTYRIHRPASARPYPYAGRSSRKTERSKVESRGVTRNDPAVIEELRRRHAKREVINTKKIVYEKPIVIETTRVVDDPPKIIERRHYVDDTPTASIPPRKQAAAKPTKREPLKIDTGKRDSGKARVIEADAEVTILGPDRMSIRLFRKRRGGEAKASASAE